MITTLVRHIKQNKWVLYYTAFYVTILQCEDENATRNPHSLNTLNNLNLL